MEVLLIWVPAVLMTGIVAAQKGHALWYWLPLGIVFGPFALIGAAGLPAVDPKARAECPYCDGPVRETAVKCRHCSSTLVGQTVAPGFAA